MIIGAHQRLILCRSEPWRCNTAKCDWPRVPNRVTCSPKSLRGTDPGVARDAPATVWRGSSALASRLDQLHDGYVESVVDSAEMGDVRILGQSELQILLQRVEQTMRRPDYHRRIGKLPWNAV
jgi:hypothetical protein